jgi:hypothetical protein
VLGNPHPMAWEKVLQIKRKDYYGNYNIIEK